MTRFLPFERSVLHSPAWFVLVDEFAKRPRTAGVTVALDRFDETANAWLPQDIEPVRTPSAAIAYPGLGRRAPAEVRYRARFSVPGYQPLYPADDEPFAADVLGVEFLAYPYDDLRPPAQPAVPRLVRLLPAAAFGYPPGVRTVYGLVRDAATEAPVANALVSVTGTASQDVVAWTERTLTDQRGGFRLSLRWSGELDGADELFTLLATERPGRTGSLVIRLPADAGRRHIIEIAPQ
ncbi:carboxypeptidase-like regulatory domain-containing protein [Actinophytocola sediminis]